MNIIKNSPNGTKTKCTECNETYTTINGNPWEDDKGWVKHYCGDIPAPLTPEERIELFKKAKEIKEMQDDHWKTVDPDKFDITDNPEGYMVIYYAEQDVYDAMDRYEQILEEANKQCREMDVKERYSGRLKALRRANMELNEYNKK